ncbi:MAG: polyamine ABC transporter substrate-binding protein, partial [Cyanobacteria bacterium]|nr:polyamine ABC transporter substrate-binding protein [Cyanobacteria bacterium CG_2015-16_32_12]
MVNRRSFLQGIGSLTLASLLSGCEKNYDLKVALLQGSIPIQLIAALSQQSRTMGIVNFESQAT